MIKLLGFKRALLLGILLALNVALAAVLFGWIMPMRGDAENQLTGIKSEVSRLQGDIQRIKADLAALKETLPQYEVLKQRGFFQEQDRFYITRAMEELKERSGIMGFKLSIDNIQEIENADAATAERRLINSRITVDRTASLLDVNLFDIAHLIDVQYPAHTRLQSLTIKRIGEVDEQSLARLAEAPTSMIDATLVFDWMTMVEKPQPAVGTTPGTPGFGGAP